LRSIEKTFVEKPAAMQTLFLPGKKKFCCMQKSFLMTYK